MAKTRKPEDKKGGKKKKGADKKLVRSALSPLQSRGLEGSPGTWTREGFRTTNKKEVFREPRNTGNNFSNQERREQWKG